MQIGNNHKPANLAMYYNDRGEKWVNLLWSIQNTQKESNCIDVCYQKSVSKLMSGVPVPEATTRVNIVVIAFSYNFLWGGTLCSTCTSPGICMIFFRHWTQWFLPIFEWDIGVTQ